MEDDPTSMLTEEHKAILKVVAACDSIAQKLKSGRKPDAALLLKIADFMQQYADKCHHAKEEDLLFPAFEKAGVPSTGCPLEALRAEHKNGRRLVLQLKDSAAAYQQGDTGAVAGISTAVAGIAKMYPNHIWKEDAMVFPMAQRLLSPERREELLKAFEIVETRTGHEVHCKYESFADELDGLRQA